MTTRKSLLAVLLLITITGCLPPITLRPTITKSQNDLYTLTPGTSQWPVPLPDQSHPAPTMTIRQIITTRDKTGTPMPFALSTFSPDIQQRNFTRIVEEDTFCKLPCYGGVIPGVSTFSDVLDIFAPLSVSTYNYQNSYYDFKLIPPRKYDARDFVFITFLFKKDKTISSISAVRYGYSVLEMFSNYGEPDEIYLRIHHSFESDTTWELYLFYHHLGIMAKYVGYSDYQATIKICFDNLLGNQEQPGLDLWFPDDKRTFVDLISSTNVDINEYVPIEAATIAKLSIHTIYMRVMQDKKNEGCILVRNPFSE